LIYIVDNEKECLECMGWHCANREKFSFRFIDTSAANQVHKTGTTSGARMRGMIPMASSIRKARHRFGIEVLFLGMPLMFRGKIVGFLFLGAMPTRTH